MLNLFILAVVVFPAAGFVWHLTDVLPAKKILTFSERYMFATNNGPFMLEQGDSYIKVDATVTAYMRKNMSTDIAYAIYAASEDHHHDALQGMCGDALISENDWAGYVFNTRVPTTYVGEVTLVDPLEGYNGTFHAWKAHLSAKYTIMIEDWHNVAFQLCSQEKSGPIAQVDGHVTFRNPYGFIPAELFGFLPFEGARMVAYFLFGVFFIYRYIRFNDSTLPVHKAVLVVFVVALAEATTWYASYQTINLTGQPYCCPFPTPVVASLILQIFRQTFARTLLLVVCLGYGIVRPKLLPTEWVAILIVTLLYFITATISQVSEIVLVHDIHGDSPESVVAYQIPELVMDVVFLSWIYLALGSTIRILTEFQQTYKLTMYRSLACIIVLFVSLFAVATVVVLLDKSKYLTWPWQWAWAQQVIWEVLNFSVLSAACFICLPSENSRLLSYASQLPTEDPDEDEEYGDDEDGPDTGMQDDDDDDDDLGKGRVELTSTSKTKNDAADSFSSLPSAEDEEYGLKSSDSF